MPPAPANDGATDLAAAGASAVSRCSRGGTDPVTVEAEGNLGLGFWTHQLRGAAAWYPWENRGTAVVGALTHEMNGKKEDFDITPGSHTTRRAIGSS